MPFDPTPAWNTKPHWSSCRNGYPNQQPEPAFLDEIGSRKPDRSRPRNEKILLLTHSNLGDDYHILEPAQGTVSVGSYRENRHIN